MSSIDAVTSESVLTFKKAFEGMVELINSYVTIANVDVAPIVAGAGLITATIINNSASAPSF